MFNIQRALLRANLNAGTYSGTNAITYVLRARTRSELLSAGVAFSAQITIFFFLDKVKI